MLAWRVDKQPMDLAVMVPKIERALSPKNGDAQVAIEHLYLVREGHSFVLRAENVRVTDHEGRGILSLPSADILVSVRALLTDGVLAPERIELEDLKLRASVREDGGVSVGSRDEAGPAADQQEIDSGRLFGLWASDPRLRYLRQINLEHGDVSVSAPQQGMLWRAPNVAATAVKSADGVILQGVAQMRQQMLHGKEADRALGKIGWVVQAQTLAADAGQQEPVDISVEVNLEQVDPTILTGIVPPLVGEHGLEAPISGTLTASFPAGQRPNSAAFILTLDEGQISIPDSGALAFDKVSLIGSVSLNEISVRLDELVLDYGGLNSARQLQLSGQAGRIAGGDIQVTADVEGISPAWLASLSPAFSRMDGVDTALSGKTELIFDRDGGLREGHLHLASGKAAITLPKVFAAPVTLDSLKADVRLSDYGAEWRLDSLRLAFNDGASVEVVGQAHRGEDSGTAEFVITGQDLLVDTAKRFWPVPVSPPARNWVVQNIKSGKVPTFNASMSAQIGGRNAPLVLSGFQVDARMPLRDVEATFWDPLPGATGVDAEARITERLFEASFQKGAIAGMTVKGGNILVSGIDKGKGHELLELTVDVDGPVANLMAVLDRKPLHFARFLKLEPRLLKGAVGGMLQVAFPPIADLELDDVKISATGRSRNAVLPGIAGGRDLERTNVTFQVDKKELRLKGKARVAGVPANVTAHLPFSDAARYTGRYVVIGRLDNVARERFGLKGPIFQPPYMNGPAGVILTATQRTGGKTTLDIELDLSKASLTMDAVGWSKPVGGFAAGQAKVTIENEVIKSVDSFQVSGPGMQVAGNVRFDRDGRATVRLSPLKLGGGTDTRATIRPLPKNGYEIELEGGRVDLRPIILASKSTGETAKDKGSNATQDDLLLRIKLSGPSVRVRAGPPFQNMQGALLLRGDNVLDADLRGSPGGVGTAVFRLTPNGKLRVTAGDAGALLYTMGLPGRLEGGTLELDGTASADMSNIDADMQVTDFRLVEAPVMMRVLQLASITGPLELLAGSRGLKMTALEAPFTLKNKKLTVKNGRMHGGSLGVTFRGTMDVPSQTLDFNGAVVPVYVLNNLLSSVPLVGDVLTGGEGVFAVSYSVNGKITDPQVNVNPLSLLAPGGLRRLLLD